MKKDKWKNIPICAIIHKCSMGVMDACPAFNTSKPCWETKDTACSSGHRQEYCIDCKVYRLFVAKERCWEVRDCENRFRKNCEAYKKNKSCFELSENCPIYQPKRAIICNSCEVCQYYHYQKDEYVKSWNKLFNNRK